ncbi:MAG: amidase domain-containing protein [Candidatus Firestonebacteria bacterium]|nr:amidase domain-containing protein [Candidatus Firestonebacteria bacterium]
MLKLNKKIIFCHLIILLFINLFTFIKSFAYDRKEAVKYAEKWWGSLESKGANYNYPAYFNYGNKDQNPVETEGGDCANYISQCLIAGGIRFVRGSPWSYDPNNFWYENITGALKLDIKNSNIWAEGLRNSLNHTAHGATEYSSLNSSIKVGDIVFITDTEKDQDPPLPSDSDADHTFIVTARNGDYYEVNSHTNDRNHLSMYFIKDDYTLIYLHIPDSPVVKEVTLKLDGVEKYKAHQEPNKFLQNPVIDKSEIITAGGTLEIKIVFDTQMNTSFTPIIKFGQNQPYDTYPFSNGIWSQTNYPNDTWTASFQNSSQITSGEHHISISAQAEDGSQLDQDEDLSVYNPGNDTLHNLTTPDDFSAIA